MNWNDYCYRQAEAEYLKDPSDDLPELIGADKCADCGEIPVDFQLYQDRHGTLFCKWCALRREIDINVVPCYNVDTGEWD